MPKLLLGALCVLVSAPLTADAQCSTSAPQVVDGIYRQVLERPADPASAPFADALVSGRMTVRDVAAAVAKSDEHLARFFWSPVVVSVYREMMRRDPSFEEMRIATADLATRAETLDGFVAQTATRAVNNQEDAVRLLYLKLLGREPDPDGLRNYTEAAQRHGIAAVADSLVRSAEYRARTRDNSSTYEAGVRMLFRHLLGRDPDPFMLQQSMEITAVYGLNGVVDRIVASREYLDRYGEYAVPGRGDMRFCGPLNADRTAIPRDPRSAIPRRR